MEPTPPQLEQLSPPAWRRGLKQRVSYARATLEIVASRVEAWIETRSCYRETALPRSPPAWRRGLKPCAAGLHQTVDTVASRVEAWIETRRRPEEGLATNASPP